MTRTVSSIDARIDLTKGPGQIESIHLAPDRLEDLIALLCATLILLIGHAVFKRLSPHFEDFV